jgi:hypothetical protein
MPDMRRRSWREAATDRADRAVVSARSTVIDIPLYLDLPGQSDDHGSWRRGEGVVALTVALVIVVVAVGVALTLPLARLVVPLRDDRGASDNSFMKGVVKVSLIVMLVAGGMVWLIDRAEDNPPDSGSEQRTPDQRDPGGGRNR